MGQSNRLAYQFDAAYTWYLPPVRCATCGDYHMTHLGCPNLDITGRMNEEAYRSLRQVTPERFQELVTPLKSLLKEDWPLLPGMGFGPLLARVMLREKRDFLWMFGRTVLLRESAYRGLLAEGVSMTAGPAIVKNSRDGKLRSDYAKVAQIRPVPCMADETLAYAEHRDCPVCGINVIVWPEKLFLRRDMLPRRMDLFAVAGLGNVTAFTNIVVTEEFRRAVERLHLTNIAFEEVVLL